MPILQAPPYFIAQVRGLVTAIIEGVFVLFAFHELPDQWLRKRAAGGMGATRQF